MKNIKKGERRGRGKEWFWYTTWPLRLVYNIVFTLNDIIKTKQVPIPNTSTSKRNS